MHIYLVRHGEAKEEREDPSRPLTDRGRDQVWRVGQHAAVARVRVAAIRQSGKLRARQTAEILAKFLSPPGGVLEMAGLAPGDDPEAARDALETAREPLMLVGHLPHLSRLASSLLLGQPEKEILRLETAAMVCLVGAEGGWALRWILTPDLAAAEPSP